MEKGEKSFLFSFNYVQWYGVFILDGDIFNNALRV